MYAYAHNLLIEQELRQLKEFVKELFPSPHILQFRIPPEVQQAELQRLKQGRRAEQFFFVVDFVNLTILEAHGIEEVGYNSRNFTFRQYLGMVPSGGMLQLLMLLGKQTFVLSDKSKALAFTKSQFIVQLPLTCADGRVLLVKRSISPWQITEAGRISAYLSEFTLLKPYENEPLNPRFVNTEPEVEEAFNRLVAKLFANLPVSSNPFSPKELLILKLYTERNAEELTAQRVAELVGITVSTAHTHHKNILLKAKALFGESLPLKTAREVAVHMKRSGLLGPG